ncbi:MAG: S-layer homology domain-containing protein [Firmicutes bacterium]|nr:S-layer homology domain-containing protein [Bacillota bacterium]
MDGFADRSSVGDWAVPYLEWAVGANLIQGRDGNQLAPTVHASRAEVATIMMRFCTKYAQK